MSCPPRLKEVRQSSQKISLQKELVESKAQTLQSLASSGGLHLFFHLMDFYSRSTEDTRNAGKRLGASLLPGDVVAVRGTLGVGKTVLIQGIAESLGVQDRVTSPTFTLVQEYSGTLPVYHMDLYRLSTPEEFVWLGVEEMMDGKGVCLVEWSDRAGEELPERAVQIEITIEEDGTRLIRILNFEERTL